MQVLCYHDLGDRLTLGITRVRPRSLKRQLEFLTDRGWRFGAISTYQSADRSDRTLAVTFDDAYDTQLRCALDMLGKKSIPATAFILSGYVGKSAAWDYAGGSVRHADWGLLHEWLAAGMTVGSHSISHRDLRSMPSDRLKSELADSRKLLEDRLSTSVDAIAYPFGRCDRSVIQAARDIGYTSGFGTHPSGGLDPQYHIPRIVVNRLDTPLSVAERLEATPWGAVERARQRLVSFWAGGTPLYQQLRGDVR